jgi:hypothetical protein
MNSTLKIIIRRQVPYLLGGVITGAILTYYYGFFFSLIVNSTLWTAYHLLSTKYTMRELGVSTIKSICFSMQSR